MNKPQKDWLDSIDQAAAVQTKLEARQKRKEAVLVKLAVDREQQGADIIKGTGLHVSKGTKRSKQKTLDYGRHDQTAEFDLDEQRDGYRISNEKGKIEEWNSEDGSQENFQKQLKAGRIIDRMAREMEEEMVDELDDDGNPVVPPNQVRLFTDEEIATELYDPLRRRGLMPETNVPDKFSRTKEMLEGSFAAYDERLKSEKPKGWFKENFGLAKTMLSSSVTLVNVGLTVEVSGKTPLEDLQLKGDPSKNIESIQQNLGLIPKEGGAMATDAEKANQITNFCGQGLSALLDVGVEGGTQATEKYQERKGAKKKPGADRLKMAPMLATGMIGSVSAPLGAGMGSDLGMVVGGLFGTLVKTGPIVAVLQSHPFDPARVADIVALLTAGCEAVLNKIDPQTPDSARVLGAAKTALTSTLSGGVDAAKVVTALESGKFEAAVQIFAVAGEAAATAGITQEVTDLFADPANQQKVKTVAGQAMDAEFAQPEDSVPPNVVNAHQPEDKHAPFWVEAEGEWKCAICAEGKMDPRVFAGIMDRKIAKLKRDKAILDWAATLGGMTFDVAANFIAPMCIGGSAIKMMKNIYLAVQRTRDFLAFVERQSRLFRAASAYSAPVAQFIQNSSDQLLHYTVNAACEAVKMIGACVQCGGGIAAAVGVGITAGGSAVQAVEAVLYEAKKRYDLEMAWRSYKLALTRPENRKLGLVAMKKNPTLAKYAVAWGAVIKKDPLVGDFLTACNLNAESLKDPDAGVHKVVAYLEARLPDDQQIVGRRYGGATADWEPGDVALTVASWVGAKALGEKKANVEPKDTRPVEVLLARFEAKFAGWETQAQQVPSQLSAADLKSAQELLAQMEGRFAAYGPQKIKKDGGGSHPEMEALVGRFRALIADKTEEVEDWESI